MFFLILKLGNFKEKESGDMLKFLLNIDIVLDILSIATSLNLIGFNAAALEHHLRQFNLTPSQVGAVFIITGAIYALTGPLWGKICQYMTFKKVNDRTQHTQNRTQQNFFFAQFQCKIISIIGSAINCVGLLGMGPLPTIHVKP